MSENDGSNYLDSFGNDENSDGASDEGIDREEGNEQEDGSGEDQGEDGQISEGEIEGESGTEQEQQQEEVFKLKIDGEEVEATKEQLIRMAQMSAASHKRFQEASKMSKDSKLILESAKKDPIKFLNHPGLGLSKGDIRNALENYLGEQIMYEQMTDEQKRAIDNERELKRLREEQKEREIVEGERKQQEAVAHYQQQYEKDFLGALQAVDIPKTKETVSKMASYMNKAMSKGIDLTAGQAAQLVKEDYANEFNSMFSAMEMDKLVGFLGEKTLSKISKFQAKKLLKNNIQRSSGGDGEIKLKKKKANPFAEAGSFSKYLDEIENS